MQRLQLSSEVHHGLRAVPHRRAAEAGGGRRGSWASRARCTSCSWQHSAMLRAWAAVQGPPMALTSGPAHWCVQGEISQECLLL